MANIDSGNKQPLLMYRRTVDRLFVLSLIFGLQLLAIWKYPVLGGVNYISDGVRTLIFLSAVVALTISMIAFAAHFRAYIQVHQSYLSLVTPFLHFNVSYKRIQSVHPILIQQLFPMHKTRWAQRSFLNPFIGKTAVVIELRGYPINPKILKLFLCPEMFTPQSKGFVLLVPDWMKFSTEIDSFHGKWLGIQNDRGTLAGGNGKGGGKIQTLDRIS